MFNIRKGVFGEGGGGSPPQCLKKGKKKNRESEKIGKNLTYFHFLGGTLSY